VSPADLVAALRAIRLRRRLRQADVARRAGCSGATISRIERGQVAQLSLDALLRVAAALDVRIDFVPRWRGGEVARVVHAGHAAMHEAAARLLARHPDWMVAAEVSFSVYGERGVIDLLAFHPRRQALLVVELKTQLVDVQGLLGAVDRYRRLARRIAAERGWRASTVGAWVLLRDTGTNHRRLAEHATVLRSAFPGDGRELRRWLRDPAWERSGLAFLSDVHARSASAAQAGVQRVRLSHPQRASAASAAGEEVRIGSDPRKPPAGANLAGHQAVLTA
jgi:transcriptional regulator with XRE-family HTH domain